MVKLEVSDLSLIYNNKRNLSASSDVSYWIGGSYDSRDLRRTSKSVAKDFSKSDARPLENQSHLIEYHAPKGTKAAYVEGLTATEDEFEMLLDRGQKYKIREILDASDELGYGAMKFIIDLINDEEDGKEK